MQPDPMEPMPRTPLDETAPDQPPGWPSLDTDDHLEDDPGL
ncbi:hypothetical protein [Frigoribacterium sp. MEB024]|nr:hypothetical protein [Frigoribacterium sp. MEB024]